MTATFTHRTVGGMVKDGSGETAQWFTVLAVLLLSSQHPHGGLTTICNNSSGYPTPSSSLCGHQNIHGSFICMQENTHMHKIKNSKTCLYILKGSQFKLKTSSWAVFWLVITETITVPELRNDIINVPPKFVFDRMLDPRKMVVYLMNLDLQKLKECLGGLLLSVVLI